MFNGGVANEEKRRLGEQNGFYLLESVTTPRKIERGKGQLFNTIQDVLTDSTKRGGVGDGKLSWGGKRGKGKKSLAIKTYMGKRSNEKPL